MKSAAYFIHDPCYLVLILLSGILPGLLLPAVLCALSRLLIAILLPAPICFYLSPFPPGSSLRRNVGGRGAERPGVSAPGRQVQNTY